MPVLVLWLLCENTGILPCKLVAEYNACTRSHFAGTAIADVFMDIDDNVGIHYQPMLLPIMDAIQKTISKPVSASGISLHTGEDVTISILPASVNSGICFRRIDIAGHPEVKANYKNISDLLRNTTLEKGKAKVSTVEHVMSALSGLGVDNAIVELDGGEPPIFDGSAQSFVEMIQEAGVIEQDAVKQTLTLERMEVITEGDRILIAIPHPTLKISCTFADERGGFTQYLSVEVDESNYMNEICKARTFTYAEDIEPLIQQGKIKGGSMDSAIIIKGDKIMAKEPLRFKDEFVRHKILDIIGDIALLGSPLNAHIIAIKPGHSINSKLTAKIAATLG